MSYKALYRTYRPSTFAQVAGQQHIVKTLTNALTQNKIAHAYLFCGPRGTGKTSMARLFAKSLNCEEGFGHQCNKCSNCIAIMEGSHPDVIEIDAASNRGIDDIRDLISKVKYAPSLGKYKVYIIDEVHMMTPEAFNALLKTLEEPPSNVVFILCTTEPYKLMPTILSRVQRYDFSKVSNIDLLNNLKMVCEKENIEVEDEALKLIVDLSDGGVRDSLSMLDQSIAYSGSNLQLHHVQELYGLTTKKEKLELLSSLSDSNIKFFTEKLDIMINHGIDIKRLTTELIDVTKDLLIYSTTKDYQLLKYLTEKDIETIDISRKNLTIILDNLLDAYSQYRYVSNINSMLEISFIKIATECNAKDEINITPNKEQHDEPKQKVEPVITKPVLTPVPEIQTPKQPAPKNEIKGINSFTEDGDIYVLNEDDTLNLMQQGNKIAKQEIISAWPNLDKYMTSQSIGKYAAVLKQCLPRIVSKNYLVLETNFQNIAKKVSCIDNQKGFSKLIELITGKKYIVLVLTTQECIARVQKFSNLRQANKLPATYEPNIVIESKKSNSNNTDQETDTEKFVNEFR